MIEINNCTLFCVDCIQPELAAHALAKSCEQIKFKAVKFFSNIRPKNLHCYKSPSSKGYENLLLTVYNFFLKNLYVLKFYHIIYKVF